MGALKQIAPSLKRVTTIFNPKTAPYYSLYLDAIVKAASSFAVEPIVVEVHDDADIERAISTLSREPDSGLIAMPDSFNMVHRRTIITQVDRYRLPAMYYFPFFARDGGLISCGPDEADMFRHAAGYVDRILKGTKAGDLPVQQPTKYQLVINLRTAKALGFTALAPPILLRLALHRGTFGFLTFTQSVSAPTDTASPVVSIQCPNNRAVRVISRTPRENAETVMLDLVQPAAAGGRGLRG
jgi:putative tryptophan/tyrosine transport system substrate-binding protein